MKPKIYIEMNLIFDNDYDVYQISNIINLLPNQLKSKKETMINPISNEHNPGFWTIRSATVYGYDIKCAIDDLIRKVKGKECLINDLCQKNHGNIMFDVVASFCSNDEPAIYFEKEFIEIVHCLNAEIQLNLYTEAV